MDNKELLNEINNKIDILTNKVTKLENIEKERKAIKIITIIIKLIILLISIYFIYKSYFYIKKDIKNYTDFSELINEQRNN